MSLFDVAAGRRDRRILPTFPWDVSPMARDVAWDGDHLGRGARPKVRAVGPGRAPRLQPSYDRDQSTRVKRVVLAAILVDDLRRPVPGAEPRPPSLTCGPFTYSPATVRLVKAGLTPGTSALERFLAELSSDEPTPGAETDADACAILTKRLVLLFATLAEVLTAMGARSCALDGRSGFSPPVDELLRDRVAVPPRSFREFSESLYLDVRSSLVDRGAIGFAWGRLELVDRRVMLTVARETSGEPTLGGRVTVLE